MPSLLSRIVCSSILHFLQPCSYLGPLAILDNVHLFTEFLASSFRCVINPFFWIFNPLHSGLSILKAVSIIFTKMEAWYFLSKTGLLCMIFTRWEAMAFKLILCSAKQVLKYMMFYIKMANKTLKLVLCYSSLCTKLHNGIHAEDWYACIQVIVSHQVKYVTEFWKINHLGTFDT